MLYILDQRLRAQSIPDEKAKKGRVLLDRTIRQLITAQALGNMATRDRLFSPETKAHGSAIYQCINGMNQGNIISYGGLF